MRISLSATAIVLFAAVSYATAATVPPTLPDPKLTPGVAGTLTSAQLCASGFTTRSIRDVTEDEKAAVYARYGVKDRQGVFANCPRGAEVDHLISLEIGGLNDIKNLWPESYCGPHNATVKDRLENRLHELVCAGKVGLADAQKCISVNWLDCYAKWMPVSATAAAHATVHRAKVRHVKVKRHVSLLDPPNYQCKSQRRCGFVPAQGR